MLTRVTTIAAAVMTLSLLGGCGPSTAGEQDSKKSKDSSVKNSVGSQGQGPASQASGPNRCALLTDDEVRDAIGPHGPGSSDGRNVDGLRSCWWRGLTAQ